VVSFSVERYIAVCYPLRRQDLCTPRKAKIVVVGLAVFACLFYSFGVWTSGLVPLPNGKQMCMPLTEYMASLYILNSIDTVITLIVPSIAIFLMNIRIFLQIAYVYKERIKLTEEQNSYRSKGLGSPSSSSEPTQVKVNSRKTHQRNSQMKVTKMLLVVSSIFLILNVPSHAIKVHDFIRKIVEPEYKISATLLNWQQVFTIAYNCNFSVNFFLYSLCGKNFRSALFRIFRRCGHCRTAGNRRNSFRSVKSHETRTDIVSTYTMKPLCRDFCVTYAGREEHNSETQAV
jgi:hypothetical protein